MGLEDVSYGTKEALARWASTMEEIYDREVQSAHARLNEGEEKRAAEKRDAARVLREKLEWL